MNRLYADTNRPGLDLAAVHREGVRLAREAAGRDRLVLGDIGPTGRILEPYGDCPETLAFDAFREQAERLAAEGVDALLVETMMDLGEALCALQACKAVSNLPVLVTLSFQTADRGGRTMMGNAASDSAKAIEIASGAAVGLNCGELDPFQAAQIVASMKAATSLPIIAQPNAGLPKMHDGRAVYDLEPSKFAEGIVSCLAAGARIVGGCCGTTPAHIRAARAVLDAHPTKY